MRRNAVAQVDEEAESRSVAQLRMLHSLGARLNRLDEVAQIGEAITAELHTIIDYHNCRVYVLAPDAETLLPVAFRGELLEYQGETYEALVTKVGRGITGHVAKTGRSYCTPDADRDPYAVHIQGTQTIDESILAVPVTHGEVVLGVVVLSKLGIDQFDQQDQQVLEVLAAHAAVAIENARLLQLERESAARARESEARKGAVLESALDCIVAMDEGGTLIEFNPAAERILGYSREEAIGAQMAELIIPPAFRERHRHGLARYLSTGASTVLGKRLELEAMRSDGSTFPAELTVTRVDLPGPAIFTGYIRDITERKRAEVEVERALQAEREASVRLRELDEMKDMFLQAVSHDLRTPLTAIMGLAVTLERNDDVGLSREDDRDLRRRLVANARKLDRILSNLLDLERLLRGAVAADRAPTWLPGLVRQVVDEADFLAGRQVTVHADPLVAEVDAAKVERILENLLVNAVKHTEPGTPVWIRVRGRGDAVLMAVEDAGAGVAAEMRETIFQPFQRGNGEQVTPGTGIGLSLVARFAQLHGGRAWVEERDGGGASFNVLLPEARPAVAEV